MLVYIKSNQILFLISILPRSKNCQITIMCYALNRRVYHLRVYNLFIVAMLFLLTSCATPPPVAKVTKEEINPVAGELICAAAGINKDECAKAAKIDESSENLLDQEDVLDVDNPET